jgi:hypothetical protein
MTGNVRIPVTELDVDERIQLFRAFMAIMSKQYRGSRGGGTFVNWKTVTVGSTGTINGTPGLKLRRGQEPREPSYNTDTRVYVLAHETFRFPGCEIYLPHHWEKGAEIASFRVCLTQDGEFWFEWYQAVVSTNNQTADIRRTEYKELSAAEGKDIGRIGVLLEMHPGLLSQFGHSVLELTKREVRERELRAELHREVLNTLIKIGRPFNISIAS